MFMLVFRKSSSKRVVGQPAWDSHNKTSSDKHVCGSSGKPAQTDGDGDSKVAVVQPSVCPKRDVEVVIKVADDYGSDEVKLFWIWDGRDSTKRIAEILADMLCEKEV